MQLPISVDKIASIIIRARKYDADMPDAGQGRELRAFIAALNQEEKAALTAVVWIGRETFDPDDVDEAYQTALAQASTPTEDYLLGIPLLADYLEDGAAALGLDVDDEDEDLHPTV